MQATQLNFFEKIKRQPSVQVLLKEQSFAQLIADKLSMTIDGSYRRIRGETLLKIDEIEILCRTFQVSFDETIGQNAPDVFTFRKAGLGDTNLDFKEYLHNLFNLLTHIQSRRVEKVIFACKDIPVFHLYEFPELTLFKMFFWQNTIFNKDSLKGSKFSLENISDYQKECLALARKIAEKYALIPTMEIWNEETSFSFMKQIEYYMETGSFASEEDGTKMAEKVESYFQHLEEEATRGYKFIHDKPPADRIQNFDLYFNDLIMIDNIIHITYEDGNSQTFLVYHNIEYLSTEDQLFCDSIQSWLETLCKKSEPISNYNEKQRIKFFNRIRSRLSVMKKKVGLTVGQY
ncbi:MAG: hypothetical protein AAFY71_25575 [Bacteroidota bacterium]